MLDGKTREEHLYDRLLAAEDDRIVLETLKLLKSYAYGKPAQLVEHVGEDGGAINVMVNIPRPDWSAQGYVPAGRKSLTGVIDSEVVPDA